ncbi:MAG: SPOR domain-containing protein [Gemmatimonadetes bacterium]|nr:SPOR domain-containing protein [Gemmatimonadota bacterium]MBK8647403.1 SPOR domain-containing protein [Gemmatimonadota bacterium]
MPISRHVPPLVAVAALLLALPGRARPAQAQRPDSTVARVQRLVNAGDRAGGRALADSLLQSAAEGTHAYAEALYARAFASSSAVEAERDYLRVSVEYSLSPRAEEATMMVAQLKLARSDRLGARRNFERLVREHPDGALTSKAAFWAGRLALEDGDLVRGCQSLGLSRARVSSDDVELANQIDYYSQRCSASALAAAASAAAADSAAATATTGTAGRTKGKTPSKPTARDERPAPRERAPAPPPERVVEPPVQPPVEPPAVVPPAAAPVDTVATPSKPAKMYSVQVAAFPKQRDADALAEVLQQRGFEVRVWGTKAPFRVRVGRYATREEAEGARARMKASRVNGLVVEAESP